MEQNLDGNAKLRLLVDFTYLRDDLRILLWSFVRQLSLYTNKEDDDETQQQVEVRTHITHS